MINVLSLSSSWYLGTIPFLSLPSPPLFSPPEFRLTCLSPPALGFKVVWTKKGEIFLMMPSKSKTKVAGLCGNYDGDNTNDLSSKKGRLFHSIDRFINSWKVSSNHSCADETRRLIILYFFPSHEGWKEIGHLFV